MGRMKRWRLTITMLLTVACALLLATVSERGAARAQTPAPAASQPPASAAAAPNLSPPSTPEDLILQLKDVINQKDLAIAQLIAAGAQCRDELNKVERAQLAAKKTGEAIPPAAPAAPAKPEKP